MMAFFLLMVAAERHHRGAAARARGILRAHQPAGAFRFGSGQPFGGRTPNEEGNTVSTSGVLTIQPGPQPVVMDIEDDDSDMPARPVPRRTGPEGPEDLDETPRPAMEAPPYPRPGAEAPRGGPAEAPSSQADPTRISEAALRHELAQREQEAFEQPPRNCARHRGRPGTGHLARQLLVEQTAEGLRIQLVDAERQPISRWAARRRMNGRWRCWCAWPRRRRDCPTGRDLRLYRCHAVPRRRRPQQLGPLRRARQCDPPPAAGSRAARGPHPQRQRPCRSRPAAAGPAPGRGEPPRFHHAAAPGADGTRPMT